MDAFILPNFSRLREKNRPIYPHYCNTSTLMNARSSVGLVFWDDARFATAASSNGGHPLAKDITDDFADKVVDTINKGVIAVGGAGGQGGSPPNKQKVAEDQPAL
jgi:hypothetical protein